MKALKSKTVNFGLLLSILGVVQLNLPSLQLDPKVNAYLTMAVGIVVVVLRYITTKPLSDK